MGIPNESRQKMSESAKARCTPEWRKAKSEKYRSQIDDQLLTKLHESGGTQEECAKALGVSRKVISNALKRLGIATHKAAKRDQSGDKNTGWRGSEATLSNKHRRLYRAFGQPNKCDECGTTDPAKTYDLANLTGDYDNPSDFKRMCRSCHSKFDKKISNIVGRK